MQNDSVGDAVIDSGFASTVDAGPIVKAVNLVKRYPKPGSKNQQFPAVDGVSLAIEAGEVFGILGPNGAGKTTTLEMLEGIADIDSGDAWIAGIDVKAKPHEVKRIIGVQLQANEYFDHLTLYDLLELFSRLFHRDGDPAGLLERVQLEDKAQAKPAALSGGQKQRFSIASALVNDPKVLFLDEPTTGLDPQAKRNLWKLVQSLNESGTTIVLTTHNMEEAEHLCRRIAIMDHGKVVAEGSPASLIARYAPEPPVRRTTGTLEDVFLTLTGHALRE
jgi:ABC-2 type transport system ATP-binding protein